LLEKPGKFAVKPGKWSELWCTNPGRSLFPEDWANGYAFVQH